MLNQNMIHEKAPTQQKIDSVDWKKSLQNAFSNWQDLAAYLEIPLNAVNISNRKHFAMRIPLSFAKRMEKSNLKDPLLMQVLPLQLEHSSPSSFSGDPLDETSFSPYPGLLHKYKNRVLLITHPACAVHCRYCFRREFDYKTHQQSKDNWQDVFNYINAHPEIDEVILSGGDPLMHNDSYLAYFVENLSNIAHLKRFRIHSRIPVVLPERITKELIEMLSKTHLQKILVLHINHPNEIANDVITAISTLKSANFTLLNQSTLLKEVNDSVAILKKLSESLFMHGIIPYYLHVLDQVTGSAHFAITDNEATALHNKLKAETSGYLVPKLTRELAHEPAKTWLI